MKSKLIVCFFALSLGLWAQAVRITEPPDGAILNRHDGESIPGGLWIMVKGTAPGTSVRVNGKAVPVADGAFSARVRLTSVENRITAAAATGSDSISVLWDQNSVRRYRVSTDDNILFLKDIWQKNYSSIFDNPYLAFWREMHQKHGAKVHFNIYYETRGFNLSQFPEKYREEWQANRDWIRLTFHARANEPDRPYLNAPAEQVIRDYRLVTKEIERFAGRELLSPVTTIHWGEATREACAALRSEGIKLLVGYFEFRNGMPRVSYYLDSEQTAYLSGRDYWKDNKQDIIFVRHDMVVNGVPIEQIVPRLEKLAADPHQSEVLELMIHEQHFHPTWSGYVPDYKERMDAAIGWAVKNGYKPVFFGDGFIGAPPSKLK